MAQQYRRVLEYLYEMPWAMKGSAFAALVELVEYRANGGTFTDEEIEARVGNRQSSRDSGRVGSLAIVPLYGAIVPRANLFTEMSGGTSLEKFQAALLDADRDPDVSTIIIDVASPGGSVDLVPETAEVIRNLKTPTVAVANTDAASAAYWLASQASEFAVTPSGEVGSIGVWTAHRNIVGAEQKAGIETTLISAGKYKVEGHPFGPLEDEARAAIQAKVDHYYDLFVQDVARGRGTSAEHVRNGFGQGRMVTSTEAVRLGMADRVATLDQILTERSKGTVVPVAASAAMKDYFADPKFGVPGSDDRLRYDPNNGKWSCPVTVEGDHVYGHVAPMGVCLRGQPGRCLTPPDGDLEGFMRAYAPAAGGLRTGVIQVGGSHADVGVGVVEASKHYDQTGKAVADVRVGRDAYGIWFAGMIRPGATEEMRYALAASDVSGHWEMNSNGQPTLVGLPAVNVGGFPKGYLTHQEVARGIAASAAAASSEIELDDDCGCEAHGEIIDLETILAFQ